MKILRSSFGNKSSSIRLRYLTPIGRLYHVSLWSARPYNNQIWPHFKLVCYMETCWSLLIGLKYLTLYYWTYIQMKSKIWAFSYFIKKHPSGHHNIMTLDKTVSIRAIRIKAFQQLGERGGLPVSSWRDQRYSNRYYNTAWYKYKIWKYIKITLYYCIREWVW